uniref:Uncharacterized protein n=1 Tax=Arundo donax TaxID=35708 RepID=A0A0A8ZFW1_ARUDO
MQDYVISCCETMVYYQNCGLHHIQIRISCIGRYRR